LLIVVFLWLGHPEATLRPPAGHLVANR